MSSRWLTITLVALLGCDVISGVDDFAVRSDAGDAGGAGEGGSGGGGPCRALQFDGTQFVRVEDAGDLDGLTAFTLEAWIRPRSFPHEVQIVSHHDHDAAQGYVLLIFESADMQGRYYFGGSNNSVGGGHVEVLAWHHVAMSYDGNTMLTFVDGQRRGEQVIGAGASDYAGPLHIGSASYTDGFHFVGIIDEVRLSRTARYTSSFAPPEEPFVVDSDTIALWHMDEPDDDPYVRDATSRHQGVLGTLPVLEDVDPIRVDVPCIRDRL